MQTTKTNYGALSTLTTVFFFWGFIAAGNNIFIPFCKHYFNLDQFQSQLIDFAFYGAYYLGALGLFVFSTVTGRDLVSTWGYKKSIVQGLLFSALGAAMMIISVYLNVFAAMLFGLFIVALGFSLQQTSANPFMISLGDEKTGSNRINLGGAINSLGTNIGPIIVSIALFSTTAAIRDEEIQALGLSKVVVLYACVGCLFLGIAALFAFSKKLPSGKLEQAIDETSEKAKKGMITMLVMTGLLIACFSPVFSSYRSDEAKQLTELKGDLEQLTIGEDNKPIKNLTASQIETKKEIEVGIKKIQEPLEKYRMVWLSAGLLCVLGGILFANRSAKKNESGWGALKYPQLSLGMLAIFVYVGVEVAVGSNLSELLKQPAFGGYESSETTPFIAMYWGSLMIGRWSGSINAFNLSQQTKLILKFIVPLIALGVSLTVSIVSGYEVKALYWYFICVLIQIAASYLTQDKPARSLALFGSLGFICILIGLSTTGIVSIYSFLSAGLFCSTMWSCIFSLSLAGLGKHQAQGSGFLVMMILGGGLIPPIQGKLSDIIGIQPSFIVGAVCFAYITFFAIFVNKLLKKQGISLDESSSSH
ncbi:glucose transporter [Fluviicola taffensis]|uniref:Putative sugar-transporting permease n=1 Tax=Fluviicola taffensis (strain DSM 16823 / NCIMB 13979 / RW262) TaxID=755732 RepID=F2IEG0_FLUTR|nr:glucose transporter [Fluviicola taffensis]AEA43484.1 putative sugar-transporting permease [Fluviicola taffensis DSM 16823]